MIDITKISTCESCKKKSEVYYNLKINEYKTIRLCPNCMKTLHVAVTEIMEDI